ncbi:DNA repair protein complementing XP-C cells homolog [Planococcus citri]|uniref:DNA repair protein complementing XP-C cells homolog n=1 Tax=Planococcus citri TaxID=170843 RepID=UPI0031F995AC
METRRSTRLVQKENSKPTSVFKATNQNTSDDAPKSKTKRNGSTSPVPNKTSKSSYFDPDFSEESSSGSDSPPVKRRARIVSNSKKSAKSRKRYDSEDESSSDEFVKKPKSITEILQSKSELKLSSDESDSSEESPPKRKKKSDGSPMKKLNTSARIKSDSDSSDEFVKPNKSSNSNNVTKSEPLDEPNIKEEEIESSSSQAEYFDFTALVNKVKANENSTPVEEIIIEAEPKKTEKLEKPTPKKSKKVTAKSEPKTENKADLEVFELLAMGEDTDMSATDIKESVSQSSQENYEIPKQVEVLLDAPALKKKKQTDLEMTLRRRLNFIRRENQVYVHKVSILCWIAHGMHVNSILNSPELLSLALSLLPNDKCYPAKRMDMDYLGKLIDWFVKKIKLKKEPVDDRKTQLSVSLESQLQKMEAENKNDLCFMFICIIRALGIKCRLIVNLNVVPIKPTSDQLLPITAKKDAATPTSTKKMLEKENSAKSSKTNAKPKAETSKTSSKDTKQRSRSENKSEKSKEKETPKSSHSESKRSSQSKSEKSDKKDTITKEERSSHFQSEKSKDSSSSKNISKEKPKTTSEKSDEKSSQATKRSSRSQSAKSSESKSSKNGPHNESTSTESSKQNTEKEPVRRSARSKSSSSKDQSKYFEEEKSTRKSERITNSSYFAKDAEDSKASKSKESSKSNKSKDSKKSTSKSKSSKKIDPENLVEEMSTSDDSEEDDTDATFVPTKKKKKIDRRVLSSEEDVTVEEKSETKNKRNKLNYWLEVFLEAEEQWTSVDIANKSYHCTQQLFNQAAHPVRYVIAFNSDQTIKDVTRRYVPQYLSVTRKLRVDDAWWKTTVNPYKPPQDPQNREEDEALEKILEEQPLPTAISEYKNHPLYALKRHLLKFQAIYPPDAPPLGFVKAEPVYSRLCVVQLHGREMWIKEAKVVKMGEKPYKIVKGRQKKDKFGSGEGPKDLELFGLWQTEDYDPPTAENGLVPRNSFGNVELFKPCMLPKGTVYLQIPGLMRIANKLSIDCAAAITGFEYSTNGWSYPVKDGFVVCEEFKDILLDAYNQEVEEAEKKEKQKREERVYANWRRLIKGMFIREKLKRKYNFGDPGTSSDQDKSESK